MSFLYTSESLSRIDSNLFTTPLFRDSRFNVFFLKLSFIFIAFSKIKKFSYATCFYRKSNLHSRRQALKRKKKIYFYCLSKISEKQLNIPKSRESRKENNTVTYSWKPCPDFSIVNIIIYSLFRGVNRKFSLNSFLTSNSRSRLH